MNLQNAITLFSPRNFVCALFMSMLSACGGTSDEGHVVTVDGVSMDKTIDKTGPYDLEVTGARNDVTVAAGNTVLRLSVAGLNNRIFVLKTTTVERIELDGSGNTVYVPVGFKSRISRNGNNNDVVER
ncbi:DUF3060 domain-containing protein [Acidovorax sp. FJL06]|uniref:DUF3060 domain-containing protein n=1 Tax=Acidovorax sp. FJL06 TaxID=2153365 RepID=UPI000F565F5B|nr:DUF3060 domain-containing protein [Acidovorax sp. FJL06]RQO83598.1 hypothetical protein DBV10_03085 [Acidovorax sp. FJL06]